VPRRAGGKPINYIVIDDLPTLVWLGNLAALELHPFLHRASNLNTPQSIVFDLDPGDGADILDCARVAALLGDLLAELQLRTFAKVSGSKGLQIYLPLNSPATYAVTREFARAVARLLEARHRNLVVSEMEKQLRTRKVFIDWSQNSDFKTTVSVYSLRVKTDRPYVSLPVEWQELTDAVKAGKPERLFWEPEPALARLERIGDLFAPVLQLRQSLPGDLKALLARTPVPSRA
jgi:bifunctional non-homologous end joining protein LigD